ncbi:DUF1016 domain-containing protein [Chitinophaga horti]|uniref:DUF1016 domain-containing protein n=1 Tax=Chitinophaga horti TaxID=2920382 RepID=A0ABY6JB89_9BACT|nr:DUF1016 domain-containing protein [Chitinophaga horti]UYQ95579.1 DUF1016 domain-containing protein [Chitinophaga horti]
MLRKTFVDEVRKMLMAVKHKVTVVMNAVLLFTYWNSSEEELETGLIRNIQAFLLELGAGFSFVARQYRVKTETKNFFIDLVFYHYILKCFVLIDLKITELTHQDIGQMDMYVRMFESLKRQPDDQPTLGIILCKEKDQTIVRYSVLEESKHLFASSYSLVLPSEDALREVVDRCTARRESIAQ